jgi:hypothetical protein
MTPNIRNIQNVIELIKRLKEEKIIKNDDFLDINRRRGPKKGSKIVEHKDPKQ